MVVERGGDYLLIVNENQSRLADIRQVFAPLSAEEQARTGVHTVPIGDHDRSDGREGAWPG